MKRNSSEKTVFRMVLFTLAGLFVFVVGIAVMKGSVDIDFKNMSRTDRDILLYVRVPRVMLAAVVGGALSVSGTLFQYVMKNPLADSFTTGVSASSAMGAVFAILVGMSGLIPLFALLCGLAGLFVVYRIASVDGTVQPVTMLLAGIVVSTFSSAVISMMKFLSEDSISSIVFWLMGGFHAATVTRVMILSIVLLISYLVLQREFLALDIITFDDKTAISTGVSVSHLRRKAFFIAALLTAFSVGYAGIIAFVGLIVPHLLRLAGFLKASELIPLSIISGALFMVFNDLIARVVLTQGQELPVGLITSALGGVFFLYLLVKKKRELYHFA